jgi:hypothetical protein
VDLADEIVTGMGAATNGSLNAYLVQVRGSEDLTTYFVQVGHDSVPEALTPERSARRTSYAKTQGIVPEGATDACIDAAWNCLDDAGSLPPTHPIARTACAQSTHPA